MDTYSLAKFWVHISLGLLAEFCVLGWLRVLISLISRSIAYLSTRISMKRTCLLFSPFSLYFHNRSVQIIQCLLWRSQILRVKSCSMCGKMYNLESRENECNNLNNFATSSRVRSWQDFDNNNVELDTRNRRKPCDDVTRELTISSDTAWRCDGHRVTSITERAVILVSQI